MSWSSGKDSAWALHVLREDRGVEVCGLLTTFNAAFRRVAMHAVRDELVRLQAAAVGLPLYEAQLPWPCSNAQYEAAMREVLASARNDGVTHVAFGDLFLEDIRVYREASLVASGFTPLFPLWGLDTSELARSMIGAGQRAVVVCVDPKQLDRSFAGRAFDASFLADLPSGVDPCGENGEFHTFACDGPAFTRPVGVLPGEIVERDGFVFADLLPLDSTVGPLSSVGRAGDS